MQFCNCSRPASFMQLQSDGGLDGAGCSGISATMVKAVSVGTHTPVGPQNNWEQKSCLSQGSDNGTFYAPSCGTLVNVPWI